MDQATLFLRVDATPAIGAGHGMRMAALAGAWQAGGLGPVRCAGLLSIPFVRERFDALGILPEPARTPAPAGAVLVTDSYDPAAREAGRSCAAAALRVLVDDGNGIVPTGYDVIWWPAPFGNPARYSEVSGQVITGEDAVPLRSGLPHWEPNRSGRTAITLGGGEVPEVLADAMASLADAAWWTAFSATGGWVPERWHRIAPARIWSSVVQCDRLLVAGGVSAMEAAAVGIPAVVLAFADNQLATLEWARQAGVPTVDAVRVTDSALLAAALEQALRAARPLPHLTDGSARVAAQLAAYTSRVAA
ncbi:MAG TPA: hypothetical protein VMJ30_09685 [Gemmatimonadales bacterium]|nr:hypothetical protein [Gemmatimonadales bacterium]